MKASKVNYHHLPALESSVVCEEHIEYGFIGTLQGLKYEYRRDITNLNTLEQNFREKSEALNHVRLANGEFPRLLDEIVTPDVFAAAKALRQNDAFTRDDGTPPNYTRFKAEKNAAELAIIAARHHLATAALQTFVDDILPAHDLRWRSVQRPHGPARPRLESPHPGRARPHVRFTPPPHQTCRRSRHLRTQRV